MEYIVEQNVTKKKVRDKQKKPRLTDPININPEIANIVREKFPSIRSIFPDNIDESSISSFNKFLNSNYPKGPFRVIFNIWARDVKITCSLRKYKEKEERKKLLDGLR